MKKFLLILLSTLVISCGKEVNCNGNDEKQVFFDLLSTDFENTYSMLKEKNDLDVVFNLPYEDVKNDFFSEAINLEGVRPSKIEKELKKCDCETKIAVQLPTDMIDYLEKNLTKLYTFDIEALKKSESIENVKYSVQLTEDNKIYCETTSSNILLQSFIDYAYFKNIINNHKNGLLKEIEDESNVESSDTNVGDINSLLLKQLTNPEIVSNSEKCENDKYCNLVYEWSKLYYSLPKKFQENIKTNSGIYKVEKNDFNSLWKGFYYISKNENMNKISDVITDKIAYNDEPVTFRASLVYFYVKYQLLKEED